jgi:hypothetical protein
MYVHRQPLESNMTHKTELPANDYRFVTDKMPISVLKPVTALANPFVAFNTRRPVKAPTLRKPFLNRERAE